MRRIFVASLFAVLSSSAAFAQQHVLVVDNRVSRNGDGSIEHPFKTIGAAVDGSQEGDVIYVTPSSDSYVETVTLKPGQKLVGSSSDEAIRSLGVELPESTAAATIQGTVNVKSNNILAGLTIVADRGNGVTGAGSTDKITIRSVRFKTSNGMFGIFLADHAGDVTVEDGGLEATEGGGGLSVRGGVGNVFFDNFPMSGTFSSAVAVVDHTSGFILFRDGSPIRIDDSTEDAVVAENLPQRVHLAFNAGLQIRSRSHRGFVASHVRRLTVAGNASITTSNAAALELTDFTGDVVFDSVSADGSGLPHGVRLRHVLGRVAINGGTIHSSSSPLDLEDVTQTQINGLLVDGGSGIVATGLHDVSFGQLDVRNATGVMLKDVDGTVRFDRTSFKGPVTIDQRTTNGSVAFDHCRFSAPVRALATATTSLSLGVNSAEVSGGSLTVTADKSSNLRVQVRGGRFTGSNVDVAASGTSTVCAEVSGVKFAPVEKAIRFSAAEGTKMTIAGPPSNDAAAIRSAVAEANNGAAVAIEGSASSVSGTSKCQ